METKKIAQLMIICLAMVPDVIRGQDIRPLIMCENETVTVSTGSSGVIKHTQRVGAPATTCSLILTADSGSYISIPGVETSRDPCAGAMIYVDGPTNCINSHSIGVTQQSPINITTSSDLPSFTLEYFNTVVECGEDITIVDQPQTARLSGIIISKYAEILRSDCATTISNLPSGLVRFDIVFSGSTRSGNSKMIIETQHAEGITVDTGSYLVNTTSRQISIRYTSGYDSATGDPDDVSFSIRFKVLTCRDVLEIENSTRALPASPWFPGSKVTYTCYDNNFKLKKPVPTVECKVDNMEAKWINHSEIKCIPVPYCLDEPYDIANATYNIPDSHTATYQCLRGYEDKLVAEVTSTCESEDGDTVPWRWSLVSLNCKPIKCEGTELSLNLTTTIITSTGDINGRYYYQDVITYECNFGYKKEDKKEEIHCQSDSTWTDTPVCTQITECSADSDKLNITNGEIATRRYYRGDTLRYECDDGYKMKKSVDNVLCQDTGNWSLTSGCVVGESSGENQNRDTKPRTIIGVVVGLVLLVGTAIVVVLVMRRRKVQLPCITSPSTNSDEYENPQSIGLSNPVNREDNTYMSLQGDRSSNTYDSLQTQSDGIYANVRDRNSAAYVNVGIMH